MEIPTWVSPLLLAAIVALSPFAKRWLESSIEKNIQHKFDQKLELLRSDLRKSEELLRAELRTRELEIVALKESALSRRAQRQALLDKRRLESVERLWTSVVSLAPFKIVCGMMASVDFEEAARKAPTSPETRKFFEVITRNADTAKIDSKANAEQPFVSPLAWAYYRALTSIIMTAVARAKILEAGIEDAAGMQDVNAIRKILKAAIPDKSHFIDQNDAGAYYHLLDDLEASLLAELVRSLDGIDTDKEDVTKSAEIMHEVQRLTDLQRNSVVGADSQANTV